MHHSWLYMVGLVAYLLDRFFLFFFISVRSLDSFFLEKMNKLGLILSKPSLMISFIRYLAAKPGGALGGKVGGSN